MSSGPQDSHTKALLRRAPLTAVSHGDKARARLPHSIVLCTAWLLVAFTVVLFAHASQAKASTPACQNSSHTYSFAGNCGFMQSWRIHCPSINFREGPTTVQLLHGTVNANGGRLSQYLLVGNGQLAQVCSAGGATRYWILDSRGWFNRSGVSFSF